MSRRKNQSRKTADLSTAIEGYAGAVPKSTAGDDALGYVLRPNGWGLPLPVSIPVSVTTLESGSLGTGTTKELVEDSAGLWATYRGLQLIATAWTCDTASRSLLVRVSTDSGSNYISSGYFGASQDQAGSSAGLSTSFAQSPTQTAAQTGNMVLDIVGHMGGGAMTSTRITSNITSSTALQGSCVYFTSAAINAFRFLLSGSGNFDGSGTYTLIGIK